MLLEPTHISKFNNDSKPPLPKSQVLKVHSPQVFPMNNQRPEKCDKCSSTEIVIAETNEGFWVYKCQSCGHILWRQLRYLSSKTSLKLSFKTDNSHPNWKRDSLRKTGKNSYPQRSWRPIYSELNIYISSPNMLSDSSVNWSSPHSQHIHSWLSYSSWFIRNGISFFPLACGFFVSPYNYRCTLFTYLSFVEWLCVPELGNDIKVINRWKTELLPLRRSFRVGDCSFGCC